MGFPLKPFFLINQRGVFFYSIRRCLSTTLPIGIASNTVDLPLAPVPVPHGLSAGRLIVDRTAENRAENGL